MINETKTQKSYILRITASIEDTEDIVQDTFIKASEKIDPFKSNGSDLQLHHLEHNRKVMEHYVEKNED